MASEGHKEWAKKLIEYHRNPLTKVELPGNKFFLPSETEAEKKAIKNAIDTLTNIIQSERVERRCTRSVANWLPDQNQAEVVKISGVLSNFGFANKNGKFLYPEETLYLLEMNRLELFWNKLPVSTQQAYEIILNNNSYHLERYIAYRKLLLSGFRLFREIQLQRYETTGEPSSKKIRLEVGDQESGNDHKNVLEKDSQEAIRNVFVKLKRDGPKRFIPTNEISVCNKADYKLFLPKNTNKALPDFNLLIYQDKYLDPKLSFTAGEKTPTVIGYTNSQFVGYYCIGSVTLPDLT
ncbi:hypothetical protein ILUMI_08006 [Ignelater luminosus]|uniref:tRNA-splicing endonuclease subunit Sen54 N-terminal domain-containing protein n=1 Tax=Ignelater luminosus TaxID=2038154 RepID=A0A8K0DC78_IGNLU|nr:hypothetical protein ILUMI_08006 [Ignelater luminosus]